MFQNILMMPPNDTYLNNYYAKTYNKQILSAT